MATVTRGSIHVLALPGTAEMLVLIVGRDALTQGSDYVLVAPLVEISRMPQIPLPCHVVVLDTGSELDEKWVILCESIRPVNKAHLRSLVANIPSQLQEKVNNSLQTVLALD
jgi:mRNA-degrading endonuclease toxin of MazEF toxin-antitoxin module